MTLQLGFGFALLLWLSQGSAALSFELEHEARGRYPKRRAALAGSLRRLPSVADRPRRTPPRKVELRRRFEELQRTPGVDPMLLARIAEGLAERSSVTRRRWIAQAIGQATDALELRGGIDLFPARAYRSRDRALARPAPKPYNPPEPHVPAGSGPFALERWTGADAATRMGWLGWHVQGGVITRPQATRREVPPLRAGLKRKLYRLTPSQLAGLVHVLFDPDEAARRIGQLDRVLAPTPDGTRRLHARRVRLLYPEDPIVPARRPRYSRVVAELIDEAAFVFVQASDPTDPDLIQRLEAAAQRGVPVYAILGAPEATGPAREVWGRRESPVRLVTSGTGEPAQSARAGEHPKNLFVVTRSGRVVVVSGALERSPRDGQELDLALELTDGSIGLDVLNSLLHDYLRAGGALELGDLARLRGALRRMLDETRSSGSLEVETAVSSAHFVGWGQKLSPEQIEGELALDNRELFVQASSLVAALTLDRRGQLAESSHPGQIAFRREILKRRAEGGKRVVVVRDPDLTTAQRARLERLRPSLERSGVEIVDATTLYYDNSADNLLRRLVLSAAADGHDVVVSELAGGDSDFARHVNEAARALRAYPRRRVEVYSSVSVDDDRFSASRGILPLLSLGFPGRIWAVPRPPADTAAGRLAARMLVTHRPRQGSAPAAGWCVLGSAHGAGVNKGRVVAVKSARVAAAAAAFFARIKSPELEPERRALKAKPALRLARTPLVRRPSLTRRIAGRGDPIGELAFVVADYESDRVMRHDHRATELAAAAYRFDPVQARLVPLVLDRFPTSFNRLMYPGRDALGRPRRLSRHAQRLSGISDAMLAYQASIEEVHNDFVGWLRTVEKQSKRIPLLAGHNVVAHDRLLLNDSLMLARVDGHPYLDGDVADTLRAAQRMYPNLPRKDLASAAWQMFLDTERGLPSGRAARERRFREHLARLSAPWPGLRAAVEEGKLHRGAYDVVLDAFLLERQLLALQAGWMIPDERGRPLSLLTPALGPAAALTWGDVREFFITKKQQRNEAVQLRQGNALDARQHAAVPSLAQIARAISP